MAKTKPLDKAEVAKIQEALNKRASYLLDEWDRAREVMIVLPIGECAQFTDIDGQTVRPGHNVLGADQLHRLMTNYQTARYVFDVTMTPIRLAVGMVLIEIQKAVRQMRAKKRRPFHAELTTE